MTSRSLLTLPWVLVLIACQSGAAVGTPCARDSECTSPFVCRLGRCRVDVWCWGDNDWGQLGRDTGGVADETPTPIAW